MKIIQILITVSIYLFAIKLENQKITYSISYGFFGELARAELDFRVSNGNYQISVQGYPVGLASMMLKNRQDKLISSGKIVNGKLLPDKFSNYSKSEIRIIKKDYIFNHITKKVTYTKEKSKAKYNWKVYKKTKTNPFYSKNDIFTLFFNIMDLIPKFPRGEKNRFVAVGANSKTGALDIIVPLNRGELINFLKANPRELILKVFINRRFLSSKQGELYLAINKNGFCDKAILKDVLLFGDLKIEKIQ